MKIKVYRKSFIFFLILFIGIVPTVSAIDSPVTRATLLGLQGVNVIIEELNPNIINYTKYLKKVDFTKEDLQKEVEAKLKRDSVKILTSAEWLKTPGRPALCITINTHESEKYWLAYDVRIELRQVVFLESNPTIATWASTWSMNMTGLANIGNLNIIKTDTIVLVEKFIQAYKAQQK